MYVTVSKTADRNWKLEFSEDITFWRELKDWATANSITVYFECGNVVTLYHSDLTDAEFTPKLKTLFRNNGITYTIDQICYPLDGSDTYPRDYRPPEEACRAAYLAAAERAAQLSQIQVYDLRTQRAEQRRRHEIEQQADRLLIDIFGDDSADDQIHNSISLRL